MLKHSRQNAPQKGIRQFFMSSEKKIFELFSTPEARIVLQTDTSVLLSDMLQSSKAGTEWSGGKD